ncbi:MAG: hypothetical protein WCI45_00835 [Desulfuromonadales bacterium]
MFYASSAFGAVYSWADKSGVRYFANRMYDIPERYRAKAKALYPEPSDAHATPPAVQEQQKPVVAMVIAPQATAPVPVIAQVPTVTVETVQPSKPAPARRRERRVRSESEQAE